MTNPKCPTCGEEGVAQDTDGVVIVYECPNHHNWSEKIIP
jgi:RNA polymerase subunit RPABC4/transcription elongation factor Spt4